MTAQLLNSMSLKEPVLGRLLFSFIRVASLRVINCHSEPQWPNGGHGCCIPHAWASELGVWVRLGVRLRVCPLTIADSPKWCKLLYYHIVCLGFYYLEGCTHVNFKPGCLGMIQTALLHFLIQPFALPGWL